MAYYSLRPFNIKSDKIYIFFLVSIIYSFYSLTEKMHRNIVIGLLAVVLMVSQVTWARCICDPADTLCLDGCGM